MPDTMVSPMSAWVHLAQVKAVDDKDGLNRVEVTLASFDGVPAQEGTLWARVAVPFAGGDYGAFLLPDVGDEVLVLFVQGDPRCAVVVGSLWNGRSRAPDTLGGRGDRVDRWTFVGKKGTRVAIEEPVAGSPSITLHTPGGVEARFSDEAGGKIAFRCAGTTLTIDSSGVNVTSPSQVRLTGSTMDLTAASINANAGLATFSGVVSSNVSQSSTVISSIYMPGAGNVW